MHKRQSSHGAKVTSFGVLLSEFCWFKSAVLFVILSAFGMKLAKYSQRYERKLSSSHSFWCEAESLFVAN